MEMEYYLVVINVPPLPLLFEPQVGLFGFFFFLSNLLWHLSKGSFLLSLPLPLTGKYFNSFSYWLWICSLGRCPLKLITARRVAGFFKFLFLFFEHKTSYLDQVRPFTLVV